MIRKNYPINAFGDDMKRLEDAKDRTITVDVIETEPTKENALERIENRNGEGMPGRIPMHEWCASVAGIKNMKNGRVSLSKSQIAAFLTF